MKDEYQAMTEATVSVAVDSVQIAVAKEFISLSEACFRASHNEDMPKFKKIGVKSAQAAYDLLIRIGKITEASSDE